MQTSKTNYLAIVVAAAAHFILGAIWYMALSKQWLAGIGKTAEQVEQNPSATPFIVTAVILLIAAFVLECTMRRMNEMTLAGGVKTGLYLGAGFVATYMAMNYAFQGRPLSLWLIDAGYAVLGMMLMGAIIGAWRRSG